MAPPVGTPSPSRLADNVPSAYTQEKAKEASRAEAHGLLAEKGLATRNLKGGGLLVHLPHLPSLRARPPSRPIERDVWVIGAVERCLYLDQVLDLEPTREEQPDHVPVAETELDVLDGAVGSVPLDSVHAEVAAMELRVGGRIVVVCRIAEHHEGRAHLEHEASTGAQDPRGFRDPPVWVAPDRGAVLRDREVEALVGERRMLGVRVHEREGETELSLEPLRASWFEELSRLTTRAPRRINHAET